MGRLTIDEVIEHCNRRVKRMESFSSRENCENWSIDSQHGKEYWEHRQVAEWLEQLKACIDADEQGLLLKLPCKVGGTVYSLEYGKIIERNVDLFEVWEDSLWCFEKNHKVIGVIGRTVFATKEEAEQALKQMGE